MLRQTGQVAEGKLSMLFVLGQVVWEGERLVAELLQD